MYVYICMSISGGESDGSSPLLVTANGCVRIPN